MRKLIFGLLGFAALGLGAVTAQPAAAQYYYPGYSPYYRPVVEFRAGPVVVRQVEYRRPHRHYRRHRAYRPHHYYRPVVAGPRCTVRIRDRWNGYQWVQRRVRTCRY